MRIERKHLLIAAPAILLTVLLSNLWTNSRLESSGQLLYKQHCGQCHGSEGEGLAGLYPPLADADWVMEHHQRIPCVMKFGLGDSIQVNGQWFHQPMMPVEELSEIERLNILNFVLNDLNSVGRFLTVKELQEWERTCY